jgi:hypothetical protein
MIMSIERIVASWKNDENELDENLAENPVGRELSNSDLEQVVGGMGCLPVFSCFAQFTQLTLN